jgi:hypothetical protein
MRFGLVNMIINEAKVIIGQIKVILNSDGLTLESGHHYLKSALANKNYNLALIAAVSFSKPGFSSKANIFFL